MVANHDPKPLSAAVAQKMAGGGYAEYIRKHPVAKMDAPSPAVLTQWAKGAPNGLVDPSGKQGGLKGTENHIGGVPTREYPGHAASKLDAPAKTVVSGNHGVPGGANCFYPEPKEMVQIRNYNVTPQLPPNGLSVSELFCGGGLMAVGLKAAGYEIIFANDFDKRATQAYAHNLGDYVVCGDITDEAIQAQIPDADVIAGGPPCQDYSVAGTGAGEDGERGRLVWTYLGVIARKQPKAFVFENVKGLITKRHRGTFDALLAHFDSINYNVSWRVVNAWDYGVAQKRERVIAVGIRKDLGFTFEFPEPTAEEYRTQVLRDVIGDLPEPNEAVGKNVKKPEHRADIDGPAPSITTQFRCQSVEITNHEQSRATTVRSEHSLSNQRGYVADMDKAGRTVNVCRLDHAEIHPSQPRRFTVRECLRIQSVPDWYVLPSDISLSAQYRIVGNGVASRVAYRIGVALAEQLNAALAAQSQQERRAA